MEWNKTTLNKGTLETLSRALSLIYHLNSNRLLLRENTTWQWNPCSKAQKPTWSGLGKECICFVLNRLWLVVRCISRNPADKNMGIAEQCFEPGCVQYLIQLTCRVFFLGVLVTPSYKCSLKVVKVTNTNTKSVEFNHSIHVPCVSIQSLCLYIISFPFTHRLFLHCIETQYLVQLLQQAFYEQTLPNYLCLIWPLASMESMFHIYHTDQYFEKTMYFCWFYYYLIEKNNWPFWGKGKIFLMLSSFLSSKGSFSHK